MHDNLFNLYHSMIQSKFKDFSFWFEAINDPRRKYLITYQIRTICMYVFFTFVFKLGSNRSLDCELTGEDTGITNFITCTQDFAITKLPHPDTVAHVMYRINPLDLEKIGVRITRTLLRKKVLNKYKFLNEYFLLAIDATQQVRFNYKHCDKCLITTKNGKKYYHHNILVAKIIFPNGITLPVATEFIENDSDTLRFYKKQDCETKAAYRLIDRIKKYFPQLNICLLGDSAYINSNIFKKCNTNSWKYIITFKEGSAKALFFDYEDFIRNGSGGKEHVEIHKDNGCTITHNMYWKNNLDFKSLKVNVIESITSCKDQTTRFVFATNIIASHENIYNLIHYGGRLRWKIENEGFNEEKNDGYNLEHLYCKDETAMKNYVYLLQIAHTMNQLFEKGIFTKKEVKKYFKGFKYLTSKLLRHFVTKKIVADSFISVNFYFDSS